MSASKSGKSSNQSTGTFDLDKVRELVEMMKEHGLQEVHLSKGDEKWELSRAPKEVVAMAPVTAPVAVAPVAAAAAPVASAAPAAPAASAEPPSGLLEIKSPTIGTFYQASSPEDPPFVKVGSQVTPETIVCLLEAMKVFNQVPAEVNGTISEVVVKNGDEIDFGQVLFRVTPN